MEKENKCKYGFFLKLRPAKNKKYYYLCFNCRMNNGILTFFYKNKIIFQTNIYAGKHNENFVLT